MGHRSYEGRPVADCTRRIWEIIKRGVSDFKLGRFSDIFLGLWKNIVSLVSCWSGQYRRRRSVKQSRCEPSLVKGTVALSALCRSILPFLKPDIMLFPCPELACFTRWGKSGIPIMLGWLRELHFFYFLERFERGTKPSMSTKENSSRQ